MDFTAKLHKMKKIVIVFIILFVNEMNSQIFIQDGLYNPYELAANRILGSGVSISNIKFNGVLQTSANHGINPPQDQASGFTGGLSSNLSFDDGVILTTGKATLAQISTSNPQVSGATNASASPQNGDADLQMLVTQTVRNAAILEFDFVPISNIIEFQYVFASEEYPEYSCSPYNDVFAIIISGPGISGPLNDNGMNIAVIPDPAVTGGTLPVSIANINPGEGTSDCTGDNTSYYVSNAGSSLIQFDGMTTELTGSVRNLLCGETYHLRFAIANVSDNQLDSGVMIKANSFQSLVVSLGADQLFCNSTVNSYTLTATLNLPLTSIGPIYYNWYYNDVLQATTTTNQYVVQGNQGGTWKVKITAQ